MYSPNILKYTQRYSIWHQLRKDILPFAGGLVIAPKIEIAEYMAKIIEIKTNKKPVIVHNGLGSKECKERIKDLEKI